LDQNHEFAAVVSDAEALQHLDQDHEFAAVVSDAEALQHLDQNHEFAAVVSVFFLERRTGWKPSRDEDLRGEPSTRGESSGGILAVF
jgi:hypothetical protein